MAEKLNILVVGMGRSGAAAARLALARGYAVTACDRFPLGALSAEVSELEAQGVAFRQGDEDLSLLEGVDLLVLSPGVPRGSRLVHAALAKGIEVAGEIEFAYRHASGHVAAVTGSNGKSTTTTLLGDLLSAHFADVRTGGNLGTPFSQLVDGSTGETWFVLELSSFQLESLSRFRADLAILLNITPDHQDRYPRFEDYQEAKGRVFANQTSSGAAIFSATDGLSSRFGEASRARKVPFSSLGPLPAGAFVSGEDALLRHPSGDEELLFHLSGLPLPGTHNLENALAACSAARLAGVPPAKIGEALRAFRGLPHRLEFVGERRGVRVYNDSKATNTDSVSKALSAFRSSVILMLGGKDKGADWPCLAPEIKRACRAVIAFGAARGKIEAAFAGAAPHFESHATLLEATRSALALAGPGDSVVLSPACASFDEFKNFEDRGDQFRGWVRAWLDGGAP